MSRSTILFQWLWRGGVGAMLLGSGLCCTIEVAFLKHEGANWLTWCSLGAISLSMVVAGVSLLADSVRFKIKLKEKN